MKTTKQKQQNNSLKIEGLSSDFLCDTNDDDMLEKIIKEMKKKEILKRQNIWQASDGRWKTKLPVPNSKKTKLVAKKNKSDLENYIVNWNMEQQESQKPCFESIYKDWLSSKKKETSMANASKLSYVWDKYYKDSPIISVPFEQMTAGQMKDWLLDVTSENKLNRKQYNEMKSVANMMYDYAISYNLASINIPRQIRKPSDKIFKEAETKPLSEKVYDADTKKKVIEDALKQYEKTKNTAYLAVCLNFTLGLRVGELVALRSSCIHEDGTIDIIREEVKGYTEDENGIIHRHGYKVVNHTKTQCGERNLILTPNAKKYIQMAIDRNKELGISDEDYIFIDKKGQRIHDHAINNVLRRLNGVRNKKDALVITGRPSGNHGVRRTCISLLHDSMLMSDDTIKAFAGHKDISTTQRCYIHPVKPITAHADAFAAVFDD